MLKAQKAAVQRCIRIDAAGIAVLQFFRFKTIIVIIIIVHIERKKFDQAAQHAEQRCRRRAHAAADRYVRMQTDVNSAIQFELNAVKKNIQIELARLKSPERISEIAKERLGLTVPTPDQIIVVTWAP